MVSPAAKDEGRINDALKKLCEEFHLGMVQPEEYRARRRRLFETWGDRDVTTAPGVRQRAAQAASSAAPAPAPKASAFSGGKIIALGLAALVALAIAIYVVLAIRKPAATGTPISDAAGAPAAIDGSHLAAIRKAAVDFVANNQWEVSNLEDFMGRWRELSPAEQAVARQEPSVRSLRYELQQNIQIALQMAGAQDAAQQKRAELLARFAREIDGAVP